MVEEEKNRKTNKKNRGKRQTIKVDIGKLRRIKKR
jgi:hypothetical protein